MTRQFFSSATFKMTMWYMAILVAVSLAFSVVLFAVSSTEFRHGLRAPDRPGPRAGRLFLEDNEARLLRELRSKELEEALVGRLVVFNLVVWSIGGLGSYLLARRTVRPIEDALEAQTRFSSDAAHELRTPLAIMRSEIEVALRNKKSSRAAFAEVLESNLDEVNRLRTLTDRLLVLASNEPLSLEELQIEDVAIEVMNRVVPLAQEKNIAIENTVGKHLVWAHRAALVDVLTIVVDNAIKYSPADSMILLKASASDRTVTLQVVDEGVGVPAAEQKKIFDRFHRVDTSRSKLNAQGYGLGLSIARRLMHEQNGTLVMSSNQKVGSTFSINLRRA